jgi:hypothetical protein
MQMSQELAVGANFPYYADPARGYADNGLYHALLGSVESGNSLPAAGVIHAGVIRSLAMMDGVSNPGKPIGMEMAKAGAGIWGEDGSLYGLRNSFLHDKISEALIVGYLLESSRCIVRKPSGDEALYTRSPFLLNAKAQPEGPFAFPEVYLNDGIDDQISTGEIHAVRIDLSSGAFSLDKVSSVTDTVVPQFLLQTFARKLIHGLYNASAEIAYSEAGNILTYRVSLEERYLRNKFDGHTDSYRRAAWDGKGPDLILPAFRYDGEKEFRGLKLFSVFQIRNIEWSHT